MMMMCDLVVVGKLVAFILIGIPLLFYIYERWKKRPARWCLHKTLMLSGALLICVGLGWPALQIITALICRWF